MVAILRRSVEQCRQLPRRWAEHDATAELLAMALPAPPTTVMALADAARAHAALEARAVRGRIVLVP